MNKTSLTVSFLLPEKYLALMMNSFSATFCILRTNKRSPCGDNNARKIVLFLSQNDRVFLNLDALKVKISSSSGACFN